MINSEKQQILLHLAQQWFCQFGEKRANKLLRKELSKHSINKINKNFNINDILVFLKQESSKVMTPKQLKRMKLLKRLKMEQKN